MTTAIPVTVRGILLAALLLRVATAIGVPPLFAPDEAGHTLYIRSIAVDHRFPVMSRNTIWAQETGANEFYQPPLYYVVAAPVYALAGDGISGLIALRLENAVLGTSIVLMTYLLALRLFAERTHVAVVAAAFVGFLPVAIADTSAAGDDALLVTLVLGLILVIARSSGKDISWRQASLVGLLFCAAIYTKTSGLLAAPSIVAWAVIARLRHRAGWTRPLLASGGAFLLVLPWWVLRNLNAYGDILGVDLGWVRAAGSIPMRFALTTITWISSGFVTFGRTNELHPPLVALAPLLIPGVISLIHLFVLVWRRSFSRHRLELLFPGLALCSVALLSLYDYGIQYNQGQGRYFMVAVPVLAALSSYALCDLFDGVRRVFVPVVITGLGGYSLVAIALSLSFMRAVPVQRLSPIGVGGQAPWLTGEYTSWVSRRTTPLRWEDLPARQRDAAVRHEIDASR